MRLEYLFLALAIVFLSGCVQEPETPQVEEQEISQEWTPDGVVGEGEYARSVHLYGPKTQGYSGGDLEVYWNNDAENIYMALKGQTNGWVSIGFDPEQWMKDADMIVGSVDGDQVLVEDQYSTGNYGPHSQDQLLGGTDDILDYGGKEDSGYTVVEFKRKLDTGDEYDKVLVPGERVSIIWGMASLDHPQLKHDVSIAEGYLDPMPLGLEEEGEKAAPAPAAVAATTAALATSEQEGILFIREEEKMARDLYFALYNQFKLPVLKNTADSEQKHMDSVKLLIDRYGLEDPVQEEPGKFTNQELQAMYDDMLEKGKRSPEDALKVGAAVEEINIQDLEALIDDTDKEDLKAVYQGLLAGSSKHLRSYVRAQEEDGVEYTPQYLSQEEYDKIVK